MCSRVRYRAHAESLHTTQLGGYHLKVTTIEHGSGGEARHNNKRNKPRTNGMTQYGGAKPLSLTTIRRGTHGE